MRCDICGKTYEPYKRDIKKPFPNNDFMEEVISDVNAFIFGCINADSQKGLTLKGTKKDLCPECLDSLVNWINERNE